MTAIILFGGSVAYKPKAAKDGNYQIVADQRCAAPLMDLMHGNQNAHITADQFSRLRSILDNCGGKLIPLGN